MTSNNQITCCVESAEIVMHQQFFNELYFQVKIVFSYGEVKYGMFKVDLTCFKSWKGELNDAIDKRRQKVESRDGRSNIGRSEDDCGRQEETCPSAKCSEVNCLRSKRKSSRNVFSSFIEKWNYYTTKGSTEKSTDPPTSTEE